MKRNKATGGVRLAKLIEQNTPPFRGGVWLNAYDCSWNDKITGTITTRINAGNNWFVTQVVETE